MAELIQIIKQIIDSRPHDLEEIILPVEMLNGLPVSIRIVIQPNLYNYLFFIDVDCEDIIVEPDEEPLKLLQKLFYEIPIINPVIDNEYFIESFKNIVNSLRYDNKSGKIEDGEDENDTKFFRDLIINENITFREEDFCPVCSEITKTKTQCNHSLCFICWSKIKGDVKPCPICRQAIYFNKN